MRLWDGNPADFDCKALGCVPASSGYLQAMKDVCTKHGVLIIFDEVMCGMGRTGFLHAWQAENVVPDIQIVGKGLAGGYAQISAMLISKHLSEALEASKSAFNHGHTFQNSPIPCAAALAVQEFIRDRELVSNIAYKGTMLREKLEQTIGGHRYVGNIRGVPGFIGVRFRISINNWVKRSDRFCRWNSFMIKPQRNLFRPLMLLLGGYTRWV